MFGGATLPGLVHLRSAQAPRQGKVQALTGHDRVEVGVLAERAPVGLAQGGTAFAACLAFAVFGGPAGAETFAGRCL